MERKCKLPAANGQGDDSYEAHPSSKGPPADKGQGDQKGIKGVSRR